MQLILYPVSEDPMPEDLVEESWQFRAFLAFALGASLTFACCDSSKMQTHIPWNPSYGEFCGLG